MLTSFINLFGLVINFVGSIILALGVIAKPKDALRLGISSLGSVNEDINKQLPSVQNILRQSRLAICGIIIISIGFFLQLICALFPILGFNF